MKYKLFQILYSFLKLNVLCNFSIIHLLFKSAKIKHFFPMLYNSFFYLNDLGIFIFGVNAILFLLGGVGGRRGLLDSHFPDFVLFSAPRAAPPCSPQAHNMPRGSPDPLGLATLPSFGHDFPSLQPIPPAAARLDQSTYPEARLAGMSGCAPTGTCRGSSRQRRRTR